MEKIKTFIDWLVKKPLITKIGFIIACLSIALALAFSSCSTWKGAIIGGVHQVDKVVKDSVSYSTNWSK